jgi:hypothetical protein
VDFPATGSKYGNWKVISSRPVQKDGREAVGCRCDGCGQIKYLNLEKLLSAYPPACRSCSRRQEWQHHREWLKENRHEEWEKRERARKDQSAEARRQRGEARERKRIERLEEKRRRADERAAIRVRVEQMTPEEWKSYRRTKAGRKAVAAFQGIDQFKDMARVLSVPAPRLPDRLQPDRRLPHFTCAGCGLERIDCGQAFCRLCEPVRARPRKCVCYVCEKEFISTAGRHCPECWRFLAPSRRRPAKVRLGRSIAYLYAGENSWQELAVRYLEEERGGWANDLE